jgi:hypothetical protein
MKSKKSMWQQHKKGTYRLVWVVRGVNCPIPSMWLSRRKSYNDQVVLEHDTDEAVYLDDVFFTESDALHEVEKRKRIYKDILNMQLNELNRK